MSEAPERIYLDGDVEAGDGMFPRCFENAKYASDPPVEYIRSDLAAAKLATCEKYRDAYAECDRIGTQAVRDLEAKLSESEALLAKAVWALDKIKRIDNLVGVFAACERTIAELTSSEAAYNEVKGGKDG